MVSRMAPVAARGAAGEAGRPTRFSSPDDRRGLSASAQEDKMRVHNRFVVATAIVALLALVAWLAPSPAPAQSRTFVWKVQIGRAHV